MSPEGSGSYPGEIIGLIFSPAPPYKTRCPRGRCGERERRRRGHRANRSLYAPTCIPGLLPARNAAGWIACEHLLSHKLFIKRAGAVKPRPSYALFLLFLPGSRSLREGLRAPSRLRRSHGELATTFAYVVSLRFELKSSLLVSNITSLGDLLSART
jgi:hypothetical protein